VAQASMVLFMALFTCELCGTLRYLVVCKVVEAEATTLDNGKAVFVGSNCATQAGFACSFAKT